MPRHGNLGQRSLSLCPWVLHCGCPELYSVEGSPRVSCATRDIEYLQLQKKTITNNIDPFSKCCDFHSIWFSSEFHQFTPSVQWVVDNFDGHIFMKMLSIYFISTLYTVQFWWSNVYYLCISCVVRLAFSWKWNNIDPFPKCCNFYSRVIPCEMSKFSEKLLLKVFKTCWKNSG